MQQDTPKRRRWPIALLLALPILAGIWAGAWYVAAGRAEAAIAGWREREAKAGRIHTCGSQTIGGFPFRFEMRCADPRLELKSAAQPVTIKAGDIRIRASIWQPTLLTSEIAGPLTIAEPGQPAAITANWQQARTEVRGIPTMPEQVVIVLDKPVVERNDGGQKQSLLSANRLELGGRMLEGSAVSNPVVEVTLRLDSASAPKLHALTEAPLDADVTAVLRGLKDFRPKPWPARFREIQQAGGRIEFAGARIKRGETLATINGALGLSPSGRPDGQLRVAVANLINLMPALGLDGRSGGGSKPLDSAANSLDRVAPGLGGIARHNAGPALVAGLSFIGQPAEIEGKRAIALPLRFNDGVVTLGPIPLGQAAPLF